MDYSWMVDAACKGKADLFFPGTGTGYRKARKICAGCPVQLQCLDYGHVVINLSSPSNRGLWGGLTTDELISSETTGVVSEHECKNPLCREMVGARKNGRGRTRQYCSRVCYKHHWEEQNRIITPR